jgi:hypothetical protein
VHNGNVINGYLFLMAGLIALMVSIAIATIMVTKYLYMSFILFIASICFIKNGLKEIRPLSKKIYDFRKVNKKGAKI